MEVIPMIFGGFAGNSYLLRTDGGFVLVDTARASKRKRMEAELADAGCEPGKLSMIVLTHGDFDHTGNAAYFRRRYEAGIAMHRDDFDMVVRGDMFANRTSGNRMMRAMVNMLFGIERFTPDMALDEDTDLSAYGLNVLHLPGHTKGSLGFLTVDGDLICGDILENTKTPQMGSLIDDMEAANRQAERLKAMPVRTVYPGHGRPFEMSALKI